jgi:galactitol-specific phosphotransferase system IIB component
MVMSRPCFRIALHIVFACGHGVIVSAAIPATVITVTEHMHRDHPDEEQHPNPVL